MIRRLTSVFLFLACTAPAFGHFVFVVPQTDATAQVIMSETLEPAEEVDVAIIRGAVLRLRDAGGKDVALTLTGGERGLRTALTGVGTRVIHGIADLGVNQRGATPNVLLYYPKTILGDAFDPKTIVGESAVVELVPVGKVGALRLQFLARGKAQPNAEVTVILPDGKEKKVTTDKEGFTEVLEQTGRYGAWARFWESTPGEWEGKKYSEVRHYATLVFDAGKALREVGAASRPALPAAKPFGTMPEAASSFGAVASEGWLYLYGGHVVPTHSYSTEAVSGKFSRLNLADGVTWESLPGGPRMQGLNLAAYGGKIYRVGGMEPRNKPSEPADNYSLAECARFDPVEKKWEAIPALPEGRSSHDVAVIGDTLYVVGGWTLQGKGETVWRGDGLAMDLAAPVLEWKAFEQPFKRRALITAVHGGKLYVMGGFNEASEIVSEVAIYDPRAKKWSAGPALVGPEENTFGPAACEVAGELYVSLADGILYRLDDAGGGRWVPIAAATPRIVHRIAPSGQSVLIMGGAGKGQNFDLIEAIAPVSR